MTRLNRVIKCFNDYDNAIERIMPWLSESELIVVEQLLTDIRNETSLLIGELRKHGCRREN
jgi:hypothetical protein